MSAEIVDLAAIRSMLRSQDLIADIFRAPPPPAPAARFRVGQAVTVEIVTDRGRPHTQAGTVTAIWPDARGGGDGQYRVICHDGVARLVRADRLRPR